MIITVKQWNRGALIIGLLLCAMAIILSRMYFSMLQRDAMTSHVEQVESVANRIEQILMNTQSHVRRMQNAAQFSLHNNSSPKQLDGLLAAPPTAPTAEWYTLDALQTSAPQANMGNVFLVGNPKSSTVQRELRLIEALFPIAAASHLADSAIQWTFYTSFVSRLAAIFPYRDYEGLIHDSEVDSLIVFFERHLPLEKRRESVAALSSVQSPVWQSAHLDRAGAGWVVPLTAPVRFKGEVLGAVSADVRLSFLSAHLARESMTPQRLILLDDRLQILADSRSSNTEATRLEHWQERLPVTVLDTAEKIDSKTIGWVSGKDVNFYVRPIAQSQWQLVSMMPTGDLFFLARIHLLWVGIPVLTVLMFAFFWAFRHAQLLKERESSWSDH